MSKKIARAAMLLGLAAGFLTAASISSCANRMPGQNPAHTALQLGDRMIDPDDEASFGELLSELEAKRVIFVGETHDRYDHHLNQLAIIRGLHERGVDLAVGMEFFQEPFQPFLDQYVAGELSERELLRKTEYFDRWRFDYRLYREILQLARSQRIPLIALNAPTELVAQVSSAGLEGLSPRNRARLPRDLMPADAAYKDRLRPIFAMHGEMPEDRFQRFVEVQLLWDEHMARVASDFLSEHPEKTLVVLAGSGHIAYPDAIPGRLARLSGEDHAVLVTGGKAVTAAIDVDHILAPKNTRLEEPGRLGMMLDTGKQGVDVRKVRPKSPAEQAGFLPGDRIHSIAGEPVRDMQDVRLALLDLSPGDMVWVEVQPVSSPSGSGRATGRALTLL